MMQQQKKLLKPHPFTISWVEKNHPAGRCVHCGAEPAHGGGYIQMGLCAEGLIMVWVL